MAYYNLKNKLCNSCKVTLPNWNAKFVVDCDSSNFALKAMLSQVINGVKRSVMYAIRVLNVAEKNYSNRKKNY